MITVTAAEIQNNFGKYLQAVQAGDEILILCNGKKVAKLSPQRDDIVLEDFIGVLKNDYDEKAMRAERIEKHESVDRYKHNP